MNLKTKTALLTLIISASFAHIGFSADAQQIADAVVKASGGETWPKVKEIDFTFNVDAGGKLVISAAHKWDLVKNTDQVTWNGKTASVDMNSGTAPKGDAMEAFKRWTNDSYWLLAPLKLKDKGTNLTSLEDKTIDGKNYQVLQISFGPVGLTSKDHYNLYVDPESHLIRYWDYMPAPNKKVSGTWEGYKDFNGLKLSTEHRFGGKHIFFTDVKVVTE